MKKPSNGWGKIRGPEAPKPYPPPLPTTTEGGARGPGAQVPGLFPALGHEAPNPNSHRPTGREKPYHILLSRVKATGESPPASQAAHSPKKEKKGKVRLASLDLVGGDSSRCLDSWRYCKPHRCTAPECTHR